MTEFGTWGSIQLVNILGTYMTILSLVFMYFLLE